MPYIIQVGELVGAAVLGGWISRILTIRSRVRQEQAGASKAEAEAKAKLIAAEAEAKSNELLEQSLTDKILREMYINKWDGKLPTVVSDGEFITDLTGVQPQ